MTQKSWDEKWVECFGRRMRAEGEEFVWTFADIEKLITLSEERFELERLLRDCQKQLFELTMLGNVPVSVQALHDKVKRTVNRKRSFLGDG